MCQQGRILLHISRGVRWDSDHVLVLDDPLRDLAREAVRNDDGHNLFFTLDYFDASINRLAAWTVGARSWLKALLIALLEPPTLLQEAERHADFTTRLVQREALRNLPWGPVWDHYCESCGVPTDQHLLQSIRDYEADVLAKRDR